MKRFGFQTTRALAAIALAVNCGWSLAQPVVVTGELGSAAATTTLSGAQLPAPDPEFGGVIKESAADSKAWWPPRIVPPASAPNVLLIMSDDDGFGSPNTFGGVIPTPTLDRIAQNWVDQLFGQMGTANTGSAGGDWFSTVAGIFSSFSWFHCLM